MSWTRISDEAPPKDQDVILIWSDGVQRIGCQFSDPHYPLFKCDVDFGDAAFQFYCPKDYQPVAWHLLPSAMSYLGTDDNPQISEQTGAIVE